ncbi:MAG TPA: cupin domain-containing protein [Candidatus Polarisedimenticolia bacterium]|nr:cupin domain-containing protein [Candidatus Polarisedimenticolia bacterium]
MQPVRLDAYIRFDEAGPSVHPIADSGHARWMTVCLKAGQMLKDHRSPSQVAAFVLKGDAILYVDGVPQEASEGSLHMVEPGRSHRILARQESVLLVAMTPHPSGDGYPKDQRDRILLRPAPAP